MRRCYDSFVDVRLKTMCARLSTFSYMELSAGSCSRQARQRTPHSLYSSFCVMNIRTCHKTKDQLNLFSGLVKSLCFRHGLSVAKLLNTMTNWSTGL